MKRKTLTVCITLALGSLTMALAQTTAQPPAATPANPTLANPTGVFPGPGAMPGAPVQGGGVRPVPMMRDRTDMLARMLNLTDEQKDKVRPILEEEQKKMTEIREQTQAKLKPILTQEQWDKYYRPTPATSQRLQNIVRPGGAPANPAPALTPAPTPPSK